MVGCAKLCKKEEIKRKIHQNGPSVLVIFFRIRKKNKSSFLHLLFSLQQIKTMSPLEKLVIPGRPVWQQTMLRIRDPVKSLAFYRDIMGMTFIDRFDFPQYKFSLYFVTTLPEGETYNLTPGTQEAHDYLWTMNRVTLELTHNHGTEDDASFEGYHIGNQEKDGFGHVAFNCEDIHEATKLLEEKGVDFHKKPHEGRMSGIAFAKDPDGYWVELLKRSPVVSSEIKNYFNLSQTMLRVKDLDKSIAFYEAFGLKVLRKKNYGSFTNAFMGTVDELQISSDDAEDPINRDESKWSDDDAKEVLMRRFLPVLELTHNHGTETDEEFKHYNGNESGRQGFGHIGFLVDNVYESCDAIRTHGYGFRKEPDGGSMKGESQPTLQLYQFFNYFYRFI